MRSEQPRYDFFINLKFKIFKQKIKVIITSKGVNVNIFFANTELSEQEQFENLKTLLENVNEFIPRGSKNVKSITLQVKFTKIHEILVFSLTFYALQNS